MFYVLLQVLKTRSGIVQQKNSLIDHFGCLVDARMRPVLLLLLQVLLSNIYAQKRKDWCKVYFEIRSYKCWHNYRAIQLKESMAWHFDPRDSDFCPLSVATKQRTSARRHAHLTTQMATPSNPHGTPGYPDVVFKQDGIYPAWRSLIEHFDTNNYV